MVYRVALPQVRVACLGRGGLSQTRSRDRRLIAEQRLLPTSGVATSLVCTRARVGTLSKAMKGAQWYEEVIVWSWGAIKMRLLK